MSFLTYTMDAQRTVFNLLTGRWISSNEKLFQKLIHEGFKYTYWLSDYLEDNGTVNDNGFEFDPLDDFRHPALIPPLSILASRIDICEKYSISVESVVENGMSLFILEKNKWSSLQNLIQINYPSNSLSTLIGITWERKETKA